MIHVISVGKNGIIDTVQKNKKLVSHVTFVNLLDQPKIDVPNSTVNIVNPNNIQHLCELAQRQGSKYFTIVDANTKIYDDTWANATEILEADEAIGVVYSHFYLQKGGKLETQFLPLYDLRYVLSGFQFPLASVFRTSCLKVGSQNFSYQFVTNNIGYNTQKFGHQINDA